MKPQTKKTLIDLATYTWVAGVAAFYMWAYKQDQVEAAEQKASTFDRELNHASCRIDKEHEINQDLRKEIAEKNATLRVKNQEIRELEADVARLENRKTTVINVPLKKSKSGKKIAKYLDQYTEDHGVKL